MISDILTFPVVFVGTELRESPLWRYIALRGEKGGRTTAEHRPRSFLVSPEMPTERADLLETFNIAWVESSAEAFAVEVLGALTEERIRGLAVIGERAKAARQRVRLEPILELVARTSNTQRVSEYLVGARPQWADITSGRAVEREFLRAVDLSMQATVCLLVTGTAGAGTSTTLMQLALRSATEGSNALWVTSHNCPPHELVKDFLNWRAHPSSSWMTRTLLGAGWNT